MKIFGSKFLFSLSFAFLLSLAGCTSSNGNSSGNANWEIGKDADNQITAKVVTQDGVKTLRLFGKGIIKNFESAEEVPWYSVSSEIEALDIPEGIRIIGKNAFASIDVDYIILPSSITSVKNNAFKEGVDLFVYDDEIDFALGFDPVTYIYTEEVPESHDIFWQSDKSSGDIFKNEEEVKTESRKMWTMDEEDNVRRVERIRTLFIGNSFTYRNGRVEYSSGVPGIYDQVAEDLGMYMETFSVTGPGWYLDGHASSTDTCGKQIEKLLNTIDDLDYVVLQEQSVNPFENYTRFLNGVKSLKAKIERTQKHAKIYLYETWGSPYSANERNITVQEMEGKLRTAYTNAGAECNLNVSYIGKAFAKVYTEHNEINLYDTDNRHQGYTGAYLSGCTHVCNMLGLDVRNTKFIGESKYNAPTLSDEVLAILRNAAYDVTQSKVDENPAIPASSQSNPNPPASSEEEEEVDQTKILKVACWGRFMKEAKFQELMADFKNYADENNIEYEDLMGQWFTGPNSSDTYYYIANISTEMVSQGNYDIILPCATNWNTNQQNIAALSFIPITVYGQSNRQVGNFNEDALTMAFMTYIQTTSAANILAKAD